MTRLALLWMLVSTLLITRPGHDIPPDHDLSMDACAAARALLMASGHGLYRLVPGFKAACEPDAADLVS